jgi:hypothetical protein
MDGPSLISSVLTPLSVMHSSWNRKVEVRKKEQGNVLMRGKIYSSSVIGCILMRGHLAIWKMNDSQNKLLQWPGIAEFIWEIVCRLWRLLIIKACLEVEWVVELKAGKSVAVDFSIHLCKAATARPRGGTRTTSKPLDLIWLILLSTKNWGTLVEKLFIIQYNLLSH